MSLDPVVQHLVDISEKVMTDLMETQQRRNQVVVEGLVSVVKQLAEAIATLNKTITNMGEVAGKSLRGELKDDHHSRDVVETIFQRWVDASNTLANDCRDLVSPIVKIVDSKEMPE